MNSVPVAQGHPGPLNCWGAQEHLTQEHVGLTYIIPVTFFHAQLPSPADPRRIHRHLTPPTPGSQGSRQSSFPAPALAGPGIALRAATVFHLPWQLCSSLPPKKQHFNNAKTHQAQAEQAAAQAADAPQPPAVTRHVTAPLPTGRDGGQLNYLHDPFG